MRLHKAAQQQESGRRRQANPNKTDEKCFKLIVKDHHQLQQLICVTRIVIPISSSDIAVAVFIATVG